MPGRSPPSGAVGGGARLAALVAGKARPQSGLGMRVISDIETDKKKKLDREIILRLAETLRLSSRERKEFFAAAVGIADGAAAVETVDLEQVLTRQLAIMREIRVPSLLLDVYGNLVAVNGAMAELFSVAPAMVSSARALPAGFNLMRVVFDTHELRFRETVGEEWPRYAAQRPIRAGTEPALQASARISSDLRRAA